MRLKLHYELIDAIEGGTYEEFYDTLNTDQKLQLIRYAELSASPHPFNISSSKIYNNYKVYTDILDMSLTQFIYLEHEFGSGMTERLMSLIIRPLGEESFDDTTPNEQSHVDGLLEEDAYEMLSIYKQLKANREFTLFTKFNGVIYTRYEPEEGEEVEPRETDPFTERWFWYSIVRRLANNDITKFDNIYELKMSVVLIDLAYQIQLAEIEENERRAQEAASSARYR